MTRIIEDRLEFVFADQWQASKYDQWRFYLNRFQNVCGGAKAVDIVAVLTGSLWLIEIKDYRPGHRGDDEAELWDEVATKVRDTLAGLVAARVHSDDLAEQEIATLAVGCTRFHVVLHMEQPKKSTTAHPIYDPARVTQKLKQLLRGIDYQPRVVSIGDPRFPWQVNEVPAS